MDSEKRFERTEKKRRPCGRLRLFPHVLRLAIFPVCLAVFRHIPRIAKFIDGEEHCVFAISAKSGIVANAEAAIVNPLVLLFRFTGAAASMTENRRMLK